MADPTLVNGQITDAVTQSNVKILGEAPGQAMGMVYQIMSQAVGIGMQNAVAAQQQMTAVGQAATAQGISLLYTLDTATDAVSTQEILTGNALAQELAGLNATLGSNQQGSKIAQSTPGPAPQPIPGSGQPPQRPVQPIQAQPPQQPLQPAG